MQKQFLENQLQQKANQVSKLQNPLVADKITSGESGNGDNGGFLPDNLGILPELLNFKLVN
ncbi:MAG: hypothetical protein FJ112_07825 [Deltaproteobacteria bacterium]|nr:hypothetical protein [Deltaproteobacteria bacterium]